MRLREHPLAVRHAWPCVALLLSAIACQPEIGDPCKRAIDCSVRGERQCDLSSIALAPSPADASGECTIENCSFGSCPDEAVCVKTYGTEFLSVACDPASEDQWIEVDCDPASDPSCVEEDGQTFRQENLCEPNETCLPEGLCADELSARNSCRRRCRSDRDCRDRFECKRIGSNGVYVSPKPKNPTQVRTTKICVPKVD